jgi:hypothetical protein
MPNRAYASFWVRDFTEQNMLVHFGRFLATVPLAATPPGFMGLIIRAVDFAETPLEEFDLRGYVTTAEEVVALAAEHNAADVCYEVPARWDLWIRDKESASWKIQPERMDIFCFGPEYDQGVYGESGHILIDLGFEHVFTGHAGLLAAGGKNRRTAASGGGALPDVDVPTAEFARISGENEREYQEIDELDARRGRSCAGGSLPPVV